MTIEEVGRATGERAADEGTARWPPSPRERLVWVHHHLEKTKKRPKPLEVYVAHTGLIPWSTCSK